MKCKRSGRCFSTIFMILIILCAFLIIQLSNQLTMLIGIFLLMSNKGFICSRDEEKHGFMSK